MYTAIHLQDENGDLSAHQNVETAPTYDAMISSATVKLTSWANLKAHSMDLLSQRTKLFTPVFMSCNTPHNILNTDDIFEVTIKPIKNTMLWDVIVFRRNIILLSFSV
jgi:hypothetical protein